MAIARDLDAVEREARGSSAETGCMNRTFPGARRRRTRASNCGASSGGPPAVVGSSAERHPYRADRALQFVRAMLRLAHRERGHQLEPPSALRGDSGAVLVQRTRIFHPGRASGPSDETRRRTEQLQRDVASRETRDALRDVEQILVERVRGRIAAPDPEASIFATLGGQTERRLSAQRLQEGLVERVCVGIDDQRTAPGSAYAAGVQTCSRRAMRCSLPSLS